MGDTKSPLRKARCITYAYHVRITPTLYHVRLITYAPGVKCRFCITYAYSHDVPILYHLRTARRVGFLGFALPVRMASAFFFTSALYCSQSPRLFSFSLGSMRPAHFLITSL